MGFSNCSRITVCRGGHCIYSNAVTSSRSLLTGAWCAATFAAAVGRERPLDRVWQRRPHPALLPRGRPL